MSIGLALSGGGVKGAFHIGVLQALKEEKINIEYLSGASSGSIVAALYATHYSPCSMLNLFNRYANQIFKLDRKVMIRSFMNLKKSKCLNQYDNLERILQFIFSCAHVSNISDVKINLAISTVDISHDEILYFLSKKVEENDEENLINKGEKECYEYCGKLHQIVKASCSYPVIFEPKQFSNRILVDGGVKKNLPVRILKKMGASKVIAVDVSNSIEPINDTSIFQVGMRCLDIMGNQLNKEEIKEANLVLRPKRMLHISMFDFQCMNELANEGYEIAKREMKKIKELL